MGYPKLKFNLNNIYQNASFFMELCRENEISVAGVIKGVSGDMNVARVFKNIGMDQLASSRIEQLKRVKSELDIETLLLRIPMQSELKKVVLYADISLESELSTLKKLNTLANLHNKQHKVILMVDLGDLREGFYDYYKLYETAHWVNKSSSLILAGVGTNLGCYGSIKPTHTNLSALVKIAQKIESQITNKPLEFISGGATTSLPLLLDNEMPSEINHLRIGEGIILARDLKDYWGYSLPQLKDDTITLEAEIIEIKDKPSYPVGEIFIDAFGNKPEYVDNGTRKRALLSIGKQDIGSHDKLIPKDENIKMIGSSSDHTIVDITNSKNHYKVGDCLTFNLYYQAMLYGCINENLEKEYN